VLASLVAAGAVTLLGLLIGRALLFIAAPVAIILLSQLTALSPGVGRVVAKVVHVISHWVGEVLAAVLMGLVFLVVVLPLHFLARVFAFDITRAPGDHWKSRRRSRAPALYSREFGDDRSVTAHLRRGRVAVAALVVLALAGGYAVSTVVSDESGPALVGTVDGATGPTAFHDPFQAAALVDDEWAQEANDATVEVFNQRLPDAFLGFRLPDSYESTYVNVQDGRRITYTPADLPEDPLEVWVFGGSTGFGNVQQRDEHTIASELARLAEAEGRPVSVRNYGVPGYTAWQETLLLAQELTQGGDPDVVVFYDGFNDTQLQVGSMAMGYENAGRQAHVMAQSLAEAARGAWGMAPAERRFITPDDPVPDRQAFVDQVVQAISEADELRRTLADFYGFALVQGWQADLFSKDLAPGEQEMLVGLGFDDFVMGEWRLLTDGVRQDLPPDVLDLGTSLDDAPGAVLSDTVHTNELGAQVVAEVLWPEVEAGLPDG
jgi:lysophospholipase L1-like esterase